MRRKRRERRTARLTWLVVALIGVGILAGRWFHIGPFGIEAAAENPADSGRDGRVADPTAGQAEAGRGTPGPSGLPSVRPGATVVPGGSLRPTDAVGPSRSDAGEPSNGNAGEPSRSDAVGSSPGDAREPAPGGAVSSAPSPSPLPSAADSPSPPPSAPGPAASAPPTARTPDGHGGAKRKVVALTFDDGADSRYTPAVLDILKWKRVASTFYLVGVHCERHPDVVRRIADEGHEIGDHTWSHRDMWTMTRQEIRDEIVRTNELLVQLTGRKPRTLRAPYGAVSADLVSVAAELGQPLVGWTVDTRDWAGTPPEEMKRIVGRQLRPGGIVLMHSFGGHKGDLGNTIAFLPGLIDDLQEQGYEFVRVSDLLP